MEDRMAFALQTTRASARMALGMSPDEALVVYTGKIYPGMAELSYILEAAARLRETIRMPITISRTSLPSI
jgi:hypothetical protein